MLLSTRPIPFSKRWLYLQAPVVSTSWFIQWIFVYKFTVIGLRLRSNHNLTIWIEPSGRMQDLTLFIRPQGKWDLVKVKSSLTQYQMSVLSCTFAYVFNCWDFFFLIPSCFLVLLVKLLSFSFVLCYILSVI